MLQVSAAHETFQILVAATALLMCGILYLLTYADPQRNRVTKAIQAWVHLIPPFRPITPKLWTLIVGLVCTSFGVFFLWVAWRRM